MLPPSLNFERPNPNVDWSTTPFAVNTELREWKPERAVRVAGVSAFGFGGTNFHAVLEEHVPGRLSGNGGARSPCRRTSARSRRRPPGAAVGRRAGTADRGRQGAAARRARARRRDEAGLGRRLAEALAGPGR